MTDRAGLVCWIPIVADQPTDQTLDMMMDAVMLAGATPRRWSGPAAALFAFAKLSPILVVPARPGSGADAAAIVLQAVALA